jgi:exosortase
VEKRLLNLLDFNRSSVWIGIKFATIVFSVIALFWGDLSIVFGGALQSETTSYVLAVPVVLAYLLYRKRKMLGAVMPNENGNHSRKLKKASTLAGVLLFVTAILVYWYGSYTFTPLEFHMVTLPIFVASLILILFNISTLRQLVFPIAFLFFLAPPPTEILYLVGGTLSLLSAQASSGLVSLTGIPTTLTSEYGSPMIAIIRPDGAPINFTVDIACSGIYSLMGFLLFSIVISYIIRDKLWKKVALILAGIPLMFFLNVTRITTILGLGYHFGENLALQVFHLLGGWALTFVGTLLLLFISEKILKTQIFAKRSKECPECYPKSQTNSAFCHTCGKLLKPKKIRIRKSDMAKIPIIITTVLLLLLIQAPVFALSQGPASINLNTPTGMQESAEILPNIPDYSLEFEYRDTEFEEIAHEDMALSYVYNPMNTSLHSVWVSIEIASSMDSLHRWETCLVEYPLSEGYSRVSQIELNDVQLTENPPIIGRNFVFKYTETNQEQAVLYWYETASFDINSTSQQKHIKISLIGYPSSAEELSLLKKQQLNIAKSIIEYWEPIKIWSTMALTISENGAYLAIATSILLCATTAYYVIETTSQKKSNKNAYGKLSTSNKQLIDAIKEIEKQTFPTLDQIGKSYQKTTSQNISKDQLSQKLAGLEKQGVIEQQIKNSNDEPIITWKA